MNKRETKMPQIRQSTWGTRLRYRPIYIAHLFPNCFGSIIPTNPFTGIWLRVKGKGGSSKANGGRQEGGLRFAYICACIYTLSRRRGRSYGWSKPGPVGGWTEQGTGAPGVFWPQLIWEAVSHWMARRRGMMVGLAGGLERLLMRLFLLSMVGEACTVNLCWKSAWEKVKHMRVH